MQAVYDVMEDGRWHFLAEMAEMVGAPEGSVSARLRDLRKAKFGGFVVERRRMGTSGHYAYRLKQKTRQIA
jgi:DNA-binding Lrp family transcriptional regulator